MLAARVQAAHSNGGNISIKKEVLDFQKRLDAVHALSLLDSKSDEELASLFNDVEKRWVKITRESSSIDDHKLFAADLDNLVGFFQRKTEQEIRLLRIIQYLGLFLMVLISYVTLYRSQARLIAPFKLLVKVATEAGRGNFTPQADEEALGELGVLATSLNNMNRQLSLTYQDFEEKVALKTAELEQINRSLNILYQSAHRLSSREYPRDINPLLLELEGVLSVGTISVSLTGQGTDAHAPSREASTQHFYPIDKHGQAFGKLVWTIPEKLAPEPWQEDLLNAMSDLIATSIDLEHKRRTESRLEIMEERAVIARELHDSLAQSLSYLKLQIALLNKQYQKELSQEKISLTIYNIKKVTNLAYRQLREILTTFRLKIDNESIEDSIKKTVNEFSEKCHHTIEFTYGLNNNLLNPHQEIHLLQIIREALSNIHKHARASRAYINIKIEGNKIEVEINDNGCGCSDAIAAEGHFGLKIMHERARSLGGILSITSNYPSGTRVLLRFNSNAES